MKEIILPLNTINQDKETDAGKPTMWNFAAFACFAGGVSFAVSGLFMNFVGYFFETGNVFLEMSKIGTALICAVFPLMLCGSHALDKISENKRNRAAQRTNYRENE